MDLDCGVSYLISSCLGIGLLQNNQRRNGRLDKGKFVTFNFYHCFHVSYRPVG